MKYTYNGVTVTVKNGFIDENEAMAYVDRGLEFYGKNLSSVVVTLDPDNRDWVDLDYTYKNTPFHRLRRITGYLVGNLSRWNNGKRAEERDRVKHSAGENP